MTPKRFRNVWNDSPGMNMQCEDCLAIMPIMDMLSHECPPSPPKQEPTDAGSQSPDTAKEDHGESTT